MAALGNKNYFTFVGGVITEASAINFPENASLDEDNFVLNRDGSRQRRLGIDYENDAVLKDIGITYTNLGTSHISVHEWPNVNNKPTLSFGIVQVGNRLWFVDLYKDSLTSNFRNEGNFLTVGGSGNSPITVSVINGFAVLTSREFDPLYLAYDVDTDVVSSQAINFRTRDFFGVDDGLEIDFRPTSLSDLHRYNLLNQGWITANITAVAFPSNADIMYLGKDGEDNFQSAQLKKQYFGNTPAPKGRYVIDVFNRGASRGTASDVSGLPTDAEQGRFTTSAAYSGRIFYSGVNSEVLNGDANSPDYSGFIFFTKLITAPKDFGECYQEADPTGEHVSELIDTDGGYIQIPDATNIMKLIDTNKSIVVIAENGVWEIMGVAESGFTATGYQVNKVSSIGAVGPETIVEVEGALFYWAKSGIYLLQVENVSGTLQAQNVSATTIQTLYTDISGVAQQQAIGKFDAASREVVWLYNDEDDYDGIEHPNKYNRQLVFDIELQAFYRTSFSSVGEDSPYVAYPIITPNFITTEYISSVLAGGVDVVVGADPVIIKGDARGRGDSQTKYLTIIPNGAGNAKFTFSLLRNGKFVDWEQYDGEGVSYSSFLITGYETSGDATRWKQAPYIVFLFERTEDGFEEVAGDIVLKNQSSCLVTPEWDFADSAGGGKIGTTFEAYRFKRNYIAANANDEFTYGTKVIRTKNKIRGKGNALSLRIESSEGRDMHLLGWGTVYMGAEAL